MSFGPAKAMDNVAREKRSQRMFYLLIVALLLGYAGIKYRHIMTAMDVYQGQVLTTDTTGAAK